MPVAFFDVVVVGRANAAQLQGAALRYGASHQLPANLPHSSQCHCRHHYAAEEERDGPEGDEREERILSNEASCSFGAHEAKLEPASLCCSVHPGKRSNTWRLVAGSGIEDSSAAGRKPDNSLSRQSLNASCTRHCEVYGATEKPSRYRAECDDQ